jgi:arginyl-tRNA synthetase
MYVKATQLLEFEDLTLSPHVGVITSQIESALPHPSEDHWNIVTVRTNDRSYSVVCGGRDYEIGDIVALAPPGIRFQGREVQVTDKGGILSEGMICSEAELGLSENRQKIFVFPKNTPLAMEIAEYFRKPEATAYTKGVVAEIQRREKAVSTLLQQLEKGEPEVYKLWQETKQWSMDDFHAIYNWLDSRFDHYFFESEVSDEGKKIVLDGLEKGRLVRSEGAVGVDLQDYGMPFLLLLKSDGTGLYSTKDLALAEKKFTTFKIDRSIYVVDAGQSLHFQQVFKTLEILGYENAKKCYHLAYGKVESADGKMSSRKGNVILFSELKDRLNEKIMYEFLDKYHGEWPEQEIQEACHRIAVATIKYGMLNQDPNKNIVFDLGEWTARTGNTGPYLLYAYARIQSILREAGPAPAVLNWTQLEHESEHELLRQLLRFQEVVESAAEHYEPNKVCLYLYDLAKQFSRMYADCPVLKAANPELKWARVKLIEAAGMVLQKSLNLIGIKTLDRM